VDGVALVLAGAFGVVVLTNLVGFLLPFVSAMQEQPEPTQLLEAWKPWLRLLTALGWAVAAVGVWKVGSAAGSSRWPLRIFGVTVAAWALLRSALLFGGADVGGLFFGVGLLLEAVLMTLLLREVAAALKKQQAGGRARFAMVGAVAWCLAVLVQLVSMAAGWDGAEDLGQALDTVGCLTLLVLAWLLVGLALVLAWSALRRGRSP